VHPMTPRLFTAVGAVGAVGGFVAAIGAIVLAVGGHHNGLPMLAYAVTIVVFSKILFVVGLDLWSDCDKLAEYEL
jgi:hypothetical protein